MIKKNRMEENPPRVSRNRGRKEHEVSDSGAGPTTGSRRRFAVDESGDLVECSGKYCRSCTAGLIADCVALCCCPCAVVHCFALAFVKAPWIVGRRCLGLGKTKRECKGQENDVVLERNRRREVGSRKGWVEREMAEMVSGFGEAGEIGSGSRASFEAEKVWIELYQIGHLGFGRVSFSGD